jgi:hypothetical protein
VSSENRPESNRQARKGIESAARLESGLPARCSPGGSTVASVGGTASGAVWICCGGASAAGRGIGAAPVTIDCATTVIPPSAPTVSTEDVAAVFVQFIESARRTTTSDGGTGTSLESDS